MKTSHWLLPFTAIAASVLVACGGGGSSGPNASPQSVLMSTTITDNLSQDYSQVWVQILKISAVDAGGNEVTLFEASAADAAAAPVDISQLASVGQLLSQTAVPAGTYQRVKVTLADTVKLVPKDGSAAINATLGGNGSPVTIAVEVEVDASSSVSLVLDFDLARFTYDPATNRVVPTIVKRAEGDVAHFIRNQAELHGTVVSVGTNSIVVNDRHLGTGVTVQLAQDAVIFDETTHRAVDLSTLTAGQRIEARVVVQPKAQPSDPTVVQTSLVRIEPANDAANRSEGGGVVTAVNTGTSNGVTTTTLTVELRESNVMPSAGTVTVDASNAVFSHGSLADLAVGSVIEFRGTTSGDTIAATRIEVEGAASQKERDEHPSLGFVEAEGTVESVTSTSFVLDVPQGLEHLAAGRYTVDASQALFTAGQASCLAAGERVQAKGSLDTSTQPATAITASVIEIEGGCPAQ